MIRSTGHHPTKRGKLRLSRLCRYFDRMGEASHEITRDHGHAEAILPFGRVSARFDTTGITLSLTATDPATLSHGREEITRQLSRAAFPERFEGVTWEEPVALV